MKPDMTVHIDTTAAMQKIKDTVNKQPELTKEQLEAASVELIKQIESLTAVIDEKTKERAVVNKEFRSVTQKLVTIQMREKAAQAA